MTTRTIQTRRSDLPLPHERDESHEAARSRPDPVIEQARRDIAGGQVDTDMRATPGLDAERRRRLVPTPTTPNPSPNRKETP